MKMKIIFATNNQHKAEEVRSLVPGNFQIVSLKQAGIDIDIPEPYDNLRDNAAAKARTIHKLTETNCFSEDTGLEVYALNSEPGVHSARYAGDEKSFSNNIDKLLYNLNGINDRRARFRTVFCLILDGDENYFEGTCEGRIAEHIQGEKGFGYDPVFIPEGSDKTFAQMDLQEKNVFSHRRKAVDLLVAFLNRMEIKS